MFNNQPLSVSGIITARIRNENEVVWESTFNNLITNVGMDGIGNGDLLYNECKVGSGNSSPNVNQGSLDLEVASTSTSANLSEGINSAGERYIFRRETFRFPKGGVTGNISEVGMFWSNRMYSRTLIKNVSGEITTISPQADEILEIIYERRVYLPTGDVIGTIDLGQSTHDIIVRPAYNLSHYLHESVERGIGEWSTGSHRNIARIYEADISSENSSPGDSMYANPYSSVSKTKKNYISGNQDYYDSGVFKVEYSIFVEGSKGNFDNGIRSLFFWNSHSAFQVQFDPPIQKDETKQISFDVVQQFSRRA